MSINNRQNTVLVVDDDPDSRRALVRTPQRESLAVECMDRGADVARVVETQRGLEKTDLILSDVVMPKMSQRIHHIRGSESRWMIACQRALSREILIAR